MALLHSSAPLLERINQAREFIESAQSIAISGHTNPDGDCIGSGLALYHMIKHYYPNKEVQVLTADDSPVPRTLRFLPGSEELMYASEYAEYPDLFISVDTPKLERIKNSKEVFERSTLTIAFDHHPDFEDFAHTNFGDASKSSCTVLIAQFAKALDFELTKEMAECIYVGLMTDTGRFQYQNTNYEGFLVAAEALKAGCDPSEMALEIYQSCTLEYLHLESIVSSRIETLADGHIAFSYVRDEDFENTQAKKSDSDGLIDTIRRINGADICLLLRDNEKKNQVRGNLRSKTNYNVAQVARQMNGGGHRVAAGFTYDGTIEEVYEKIMPLLFDLIGADKSQMTHPFKGQ